MEIYFNELSLHPIASDIESARQKVITLLETMKSLRSHDFNVMRTHNNFYAEFLRSDYTFSNFLSDNLVKREFRMLLQTVVRNPFIVDDNSLEAEQFVKSEFKTQNYNGVSVSPEGLATAYLNHLPVISLSGFTYWQTPTILIQVFDPETEQTSSEKIINLYSPDSLQNSAFLDWLKIINEIELTSEQNILKLFPQPKFQFDPQAIRDILSWNFDDKRFLVRIKELILDIEANPFTGGKGKTEILKGTNGKSSKRIVKKDRIVYTFSNEKIIIHQCREHT